MEKVKCECCQELFNLSEVEAIGWEGKIAVSWICQECAMKANDAYEASCMDAEIYQDQCWGY